MAAAQTDQFNVNGQVLKWARLAAGVSVDEASARARVDPTTVMEWEDGRSTPSLAHLRSLATTYRRPVSALLLPKPPEDVGPFPRDFRTVGGREPRMTRAVLTTLRRARRLQRLTTELLQDRELELPLSVGRATIGDAAADVARAERDRLGVTTTMQRSWPNPNAAFNQWRGRLQSLGLLVLQERMPRDDCRGFALWSDRWVPAIVVTNDEADQAKCFTLLHEYGHILLRMDAACLEREGTSGSGAVEAWCNRFAAAVLAPKDALELVAGPLAQLHADLESLERIARALRISRHVVALRLEELNVVAPGYYQQMLPVLQSDWSRPQTEDAEIMIPGERRSLSELGFAAALVILGAVARGEVSSLEAANALGVAAHRLGRLTDEAARMRSVYSPE